ncbi:MAG: single-stranded DNA-binding protein [Flavobacteriales bacterium TMED113]|nr:MAG: single-stranded DNA-binding protein [Flavobacteriales bacterium TMED113]
MAGSLNKVMLIGNLGKDPESREMSDGTKMAKFPIATTETYKNRQGEKVSNTEWHNIVLWRGLAEVAINWLKKGDSVYIEGKLKTRSWEDESGVKKYATDIQADNLSMLGSKREPDSFSQSQPGNQNSFEEKNQSSEKINDSSNDDDDLPF